MCGIAGISQNGAAGKFLAKALKRMEYRGYDSWGAACHHREREHGGENEFRALHALGAPSAGFGVASQDYLGGRSGIAHTRWATTGKVSLENTHPIPGGQRLLSGEDSFTCPTVYVVHNGIIDNHLQLRKEIRERGEFVFTSDTDTQVIANLLAATKLKTGGDWVKMLQAVVARLKGQYAFAAIFRDLPNYVVFAANGSPLVVSHHGLLASDPAALDGEATHCYRLKDGDIGMLCYGGATVFSKGKYLYGSDMCKVSVQATPEPAEATEKRPHTLREIEEQPAVVRRLARDPASVRGIDRLLMFGCGSSYNAALLGRRFFHAANVEAGVEYATEMPDVPLQDFRTTYVALTQSGETKDTLRAMEHLTMGLGCNDQLVLLTNAEQSTAANFAKRVIALDCGKEVGVAATKSFTAQAVRLYQMAQVLVAPARVTAELHLLSEQMKWMVRDEKGAKAIADLYRDKHNILYLGRGPMYPVAREGALKMKEVAYRHAEAMPASEMKHGPIALVDKTTLCVLLLSHGDEEHVKQILNNVDEIAARDGDVLVVADVDVAESTRIEERGFPVLKVASHPNALLQPLLHNVALQLLACHAAASAGLNVDRPRNLAKSVTV